MDKNGTNDDRVKIVCPRAEELGVIVNNVRCDECGLSFSNEPRLRMHVLKIHERKSLKKNAKENVRYHCPVAMCVYALKSQRYFTTMKYLKQHYLKVHAAKKFPCTQCDKSFSTEAARLAHLRVCGVQFSCSCRRIFGTYEALLTHGKRAAHAVDEKYKKTLVGKLGAKSPTRMKVALMVSRRDNNEPISILPRSVENSLLAGAAKISFDVAVQTDEMKRQRKTASPSKSVKRRESRQTQTSLSTKVKRARKTVETQTTMKNPKNSSRNSANNEKSSLSFVKDLSLNENFSSDTLFPSSPLELQHDVVALQDFWEEKNTSLGTQTAPHKDFLEALGDSVAQTDLDLFCHRDNAAITKSTKITMTTKSSRADDSCCSCDNGSAISRSDPMLTIDNFANDRFSSIETQTEVADEMTNGHFFDNDVVSGVGRNFALSSNNETQTTENFDNIEQLLYSNTCTQTCNDILPSDLGLTDIQTQTAWHELEQASINHAAPTRIAQRRNLVNSSSRSWLNARISHTETQTDLFAMFDEFS